MSCIADVPSVSSFQLNDAGYDNSNSNVTGIQGRQDARSNEIIGNSLKNNEAYLHWLWIDNIEKNPQAVIYVPTEANLPIFEASRLNNLKPKD